MLSNEQIELLHWIAAQPDPVSLQEMQNRHAPAFSKRRIDLLRKEELLDWEYLSPDLVVGYFVSDHGSAVLLKLQEDYQKAADAKANDKRKEISALRNSIIGAVVGALLTLFVEHFSEIANGLITLRKLLLERFG